MIKSIKFIDDFPVEDVYKKQVQFDFTEGLNVLWGANGCLSSDTQILTTKGVKLIEDIQVGDYVYSEEGLPIKVLKKFNTGIKDVVELKSDKKIWAKCTQDHVWLSKTKSNTDKCVMTKDFTFNSQKIKRLYNKSNLGEVNYNRAYSLGAFLGDGCCKQSKVNNTYYISNENEVLVKYISNEINGEYKKNNGNNYTWRIFGESKDELYLNWCEDKYAHEKICDLNIIKQWNRKTCLNFLAGLIDTDGSIYKRSNNCFIIDISLQSKSIIDCVEYLFLNLWGAIGNRYTDDRNKYKNGCVYCISFKKIEDTYNILSELKKYLIIKNVICESIKKPNNYGYIGLKKGNIIKNVQTYDIHVDSITNLYCLANGLVTHNSGKSLALRFIKAYASIEKAGWSKLVDPAKLSSNNLPYGYNGLTPEKVNAHVAWDGQPCFYNAGDIAVSNTFFYQNVGQSDDGITTEEEQFKALYEKPSSGQYRIQKINKILSLVKDSIPSILDDVPEVTKNKPHTSFQEKYINSLPKNGPVTLLLDEPERSLSLPKQKRLLDVLLEFSQDFQIIIACHSPFVLYLPEDRVNIINMEENYYQECKELFEIE